MNCEICGKEITESRYTNAVLCSSDCFTRNYWRQIIAEKEKHIIINGHCYCDGGETEESDKYSGYSGRRFWIRFFDGVVFTTNNLWCQGEIPKEFRKELPDNAEFYMPLH